MAKYLIDVNLPYRFSLWQGPEYIHVRDIDDEWSDTDIWHYAKENHLTIVTKDTDFSDRLILNQPPPRVIHIKFGNMKMREFYNILHSIWEEVCRLSEQYKLIRIYRDRLECID